MTQQAYEYFLRFSTDYFQKVFANCKSYQRLEPVDFFHNSLEKTNNLSDLKKTILSEIYVEYYSYLGELQQNGLPILKEKQCKKCQKIKDCSEFYIILDKRYNFKFCESNCKECKKKKKSSPEFKLKNRIYYAKSEHTRESSKLRSKIYYADSKEKSKKWWDLLDVKIQNELLSTLNIKKVSRKAILKMWAFNKKNDENKTET